MILCLSSDDVNGDLSCLVKVVEKSLNKDKRNKRKSDFNTMSNKLKRFTSVPSLYQPFLTRQSELFMSVSQIKIHFCKITLLKSIIKISLLGLILSLFSLSFKH